MEPGSSIQKDESSDVSPKTVVPAGSSKNEYFPDHNAGGSTTSAMTTDSVDLSDRKSSAASFSPRLSTVNPGDSSPVSPPEEWQGNINGISRKSSGTSITIRLPRNPSLPQGTEKRMSRPRIRAASPQPVRLSVIPSGKDSCVCDIVIESGGCASISGQLRLDHAKGCPIAQPNALLC
ncbi:unnamed protein product [Clonostachys byssicola]|uniref:Uncharacterized protein n=1 Tax=Clonostachys byssicola TaxID=160290 RepID=A0A9N9Y504_9HYPO|nr:unnamed protein product [Clonostachys byssicola]